MENIQPNLNSVTDNLTISGSLWHRDFPFSKLFNIINNIKSLNISGIDLSLFG
jgi:hypothetical protein